MKWICWPSISVRKCGHRLNRVFLRAPVELGAPVLAQLLEVLEVGAVVPTRAGDLVGPACACQPVAEIVEHRVGNLDAERPDLVVRHAERYCGGPGGWRRRRRLRWAAVPTTRHLAGRLRPDRATRVDVTSTPPSTPRHRRCHTTPSDRSPLEVRQSIMIEHDPMAKCRTRVSAGAAPSVASRRAIDPLARSARREGRDRHRRQRRARRAVRAGARRRGRPGRARGPARRPPRGARARAARRAPGSVRPRGRRRAGGARRGGARALRPGRRAREQRRHERAHARARRDHRALHGDAARQPHRAVRARTRVRAVR